MELEFYPSSPEPSCSMEMTSMRRNPKKRKLDDKPNIRINKELSQKNLFKHRTTFDKQKLKEALKEFASCSDTSCDPLFRNSSFNFWVCKHCWQYWVPLNNMMIFNESIESLQNHAQKAFEYVAQKAANMNSESAKDKRYLSYLRLQEFSRKISISMQRVFQIPDIQFRLLKQCSLMTCFIYPMNSTVKLDPLCEIESCSAKYEANLTLKHECYDAKSFKSKKSDGELHQFKLCLMHAHAFVYLHKMSHLFYNGYQNFTYWIEQNNTSLHESFDSKLKVEFGTLLQTSSSTSTFTNFLGIDQEVYQNLTNNLVNLFINIETKIPEKTDMHVLLNRLWFSKIVKLKNKRLFELASEMFPDLMAKVDENKEQMRLSSNTCFMHLLYSDFD